VVRGGGKGIRPALTLLAGKFYKYDLTYLMPMAASVELMHTATLVHDDAIDKSIVRRGQPTINKMWGDEDAILLGDYLFAKAGEFVADTQSPRVIKLFSQTLGIISSGEINQLLGAFKTAQTQDDYFKRIAHKTASLFCLATESGAILSQAPEKSVDLLRDYGRNLGIAFQIVDDILDFTGTEEKLGKPVGSDLTQGTLTLPAMLILKRLPGDNPVRRALDNKGNPKYVQEAIRLIRNSPVVDECQKIAKDYCAKARKNLETLPQNAAYDSLVSLTDYILERDI
jgi:heptaprenyl diphosphate synthase/octaprenyl-diphosphate synthase